MEPFQPIANAGKLYCRWSSKKWKDGNARRHTNLESARRCPISIDSPAKSKSSPQESRPAESGNGATKLRMNSAVTSKGCRNTGRWFRSRRGVALLQESAEGGMIGALAMSGEL